MDRATLPSPLVRYFLRLTMYRSVDGFFRVLYPLVGFPHGVQGCRPPEDFPSPPPSGWSTGFIATPRTVGRVPIQRLLPALPREICSWSRLPTCPTVAVHSMKTSRTSTVGQVGNLD